MPQAVILDLDFTLLDAYGKQEGKAFNFHYQSNGYHPLVCYDGMTGDLNKIQLSDGKQYSFTGVVDFLQPILDEYLNDYPQSVFCFVVTAFSLRLIFISSVRKMAQAMLYGLKRMEFSVKKHPILWMSLMR